MDQGEEMAESLALDNSIVAKELEIWVVGVASALGGVVGFFGNASTVVVVEAVVDIFRRSAVEGDGESGDGDGGRSRRRRAEGGARDS